MPERIRQKFSCIAGSHTLELGRRTLIMGIINMTPDSFSLDGCMMRSKKHAHDYAYRYALKQIREGADILDIGGESTRPGAARVTAEEEKQRIVPLIKRLAAKEDVPISADTNKVDVAKAALDAGASIINTIKGTNPSRSLLRMIARYGAAIVLMHIAGGTPRTMQKRYRYEKNLLGEIISSLKDSVEKCLENGIKSDRIILDPGICFGKSAEHNLRIINQLQRLKILRYPVLIGTSRKSFIGCVLKRPEADKRVFGTAATVAASILNGAHIVRVHDVGDIHDVVLMTDAIMTEKVSQL
ncbi:MAG TPA: dihydropteroate synthase [Candidatus Omnitrophota bacterium]|nr:dihydropteroate synthase [Candidatus Omnitrophota bacterium]